MGTLEPRLGSHWGKLRPRVASSLADFYVYFGANCYRMWLYTLSSLSLQNQYIYDDIIVVTHRLFLDSLLLYLCTSISIQPMEPFWLIIVPQEHSLRVNQPVVLSEICPKSPFSVTIWNCCLFRWFREINFWCHVPFHFSFSICLVSVNNEYEHYSTKF